MRHNHNCGYQKIATFLASAVLGWCLTLGFAQAQVPGCPCKFKEPPWEAYGTKAACTTLTRKGGTSCEVEFAGVGADPKIAAQFLGVEPAAYARDAYDVSIQFLLFLRDNKREALADPKFLSRALPIFMRGAYLSRPLSAGEFEQARSLDKAVGAFASTYSEKVSAVFVRGAPEFSVTIEDANFTIGRGYITVRHPFGLLITRYLPAE